MVYYRLGEAVAHSSHEDEDVDEIALVREPEEVCEEDDHELARPDVILDDPLQRVRPVLFRQTEEGKGGGDAILCHGRMSFGFKEPTPAFATRQADR